MLCKKYLFIIFASSASPEGKSIIGLKGDMPWIGKVPSDMERFKRLTGNSSVAMGSKTFWSIPEKFRPFDKDLPLEKSRQTLILTTNTHLKIDDPRAVIVHSLEEMAERATSEKIWIAGGAVTYATALPFTDFIHQTIINGEFDGDRFFPEYNRNEWKQIDCEFLNAGGEKSPRDKFDTIYKIFERKK